MEEVKRRLRRAVRRGHVGVGERNVVERRPFEHHEARLDVDLLQQRVDHAAHGVASEWREIAEHRVVGGEQRRAGGRDLELVQVGLVAVAGPDLGDRPVVGAGDHVDTEAEPVHGDPALPPGQHRGAVELLHAQVGCDGRRRQRTEPDQLPVGVEDHRAGLGGNAVGREELVSGRVGGGVRVDGDDGWSKCGRRDEALARVTPELVELRRGVGERVLLRDGELEAQGLRGPPQCQLRVDGHGLPRGERLLREEAAAVALRIGLERPAVQAAARAEHCHVAQRAGRDPEEADLGLRGRVGSPRHRRDGDGAVELCGAVEGLRRAGRPGEWCAAALAGGWGVCGTPRRRGGAGERPGGHEDGERAKRNAEARAADRTQDARQHMAGGGREVSAGILRNRSKRANRA